ncbi:hypothetical protein BHE74_00055441 [Ensete ventricosum]|uniref:Uncharacterized protein n=1 Tax=Ensete ventricosum TaxID=4639 RepID=A0A445MG33_ENSVE|nr:hypothetical protein BHE74_00055441 [Ensete ventricosum]RZR73247.1 hypothetical protein BHM03_00021867 [Ensete ventricosum]
MRALRNRPVGTLPPRGLDGSRGGSRPQHGWSGSDPCPSYIVVQLFFPDTREGNRRHKSVRLSRTVVAPLLLGSLVLGP